MVNIIVSGGKTEKTCSVRGHVTSLFVVQCLELPTSM